MWEMLAGRSWSDYFLKAYLTLDDLIERRRHPDPDFRINKMASAIIKGERPKIPRVTDTTCNHKYIALTKKCWNPSPEERPTFKEIAQEAGDILRSFLETK